MPRRLFSQKTPLVLMESPQNGQVHAYGSPVLKSMNPCTAKAVPCLKENVKWVSPSMDVTSSGKHQVNKQVKKTKSQSYNKKKTTENSDSRSSPQSLTKPRRRNYPKLEFSSKTDNQFLTDDNKENIKPGAENEIPSESPKPVKTESRYRPRKYLSGTPSRLNLM